MKLPQTDKLYNLKNGKQIRVRLFAFDDKNQKCIVYNLDGKNRVVKLEEFWGMIGDSDEDK